MRKICTDWLCAEGLSKYTFQKYSVLEKNLPKERAQKSTGRLSPAHGRGSSAARGSMVGSWAS